MAQAFEIPVRVYIEDTDAGGIVYYVNYLKFMERARTEFMRSLGFGKTALFSAEPASDTDGQQNPNQGAEADVMFVVHSLQTQYKKPARLDDALTVTAQVLNLKRTSMVFLQQVFRAEELLVEAEVKIACVAQQDVKPSKIPAALYQRLQQIHAET